MRCLERYGSTVLIVNTINQCLFSIRAQVGYLGSFCRIQIVRHCHSCRSKWFLAVITAERYIISATCNTHSIESVRRGCLGVQRHIHLLDTDLEIISGYAHVQ